MQDAELLRPASHVAVPAMGGRVVFSVGVDPANGRILCGVRSDAPILLGGCRYDLEADLVGTGDEPPYPFGPDLILDPGSVVLAPASGGDLTELEALPPGTVEALAASLRRATAGRQVEMHASASAGLSELVCEGFAIRVVGLVSEGRDARRSMDAFLDLVRTVEGIVLRPSLGLPSANGWILADHQTGTTFRFPHVVSAGAPEETYFRRFDDLHARLVDGLVEADEHPVSAVHSIGRPVPVLVRDAGVAETPHVEPDGVIEWTTVDLDPDDGRPRPLPQAANDDVDTRR